MPSARKFSSQDHTSGNNAALAPLRDDVVLIDPCSGLLTPGAEVDLGNSGRRQVTHGYCLTPVLSVPAGHQKPPLTPQVLQTGRSHKRDIYTSPMQRSYEDTEGLKKLPWQLKPLVTPREKKAEPGNGTFAVRRYHSRPQLWQAMGSEWERFQQRIQREGKTPITFCSPCRRTGQIPLYCGEIGAENMDQVDQSEETFTPFSMLRTTQPAYTPTAHRPNIPGYTGMVHFQATDPHSSILPSVLSQRPPNTSVSTLVPAYDHIPSTFRRTAPLSRMVTTVAPYNPFARKRSPVLPGRVPGRSQWNK